MNTLNMTQQKLFELGLTGMAQAFEKQLADARFVTMPFEQRLGLMLEEELLSKDLRKTNRLLKNAKLRHTQATLEDVDFRASRGLDVLQIQTLATTEWMTKKQNLIIVGSTGTGKTWLACAFAQQACRRGISTLYQTATRLFENIENSQADGSLPKLRRHLVGTQLLIIDDIGIGGIPSQICPALLEILDQQSINGSLILTSQYPTTKWYEFFADPTIADAILDRIIHQAHPIAIQGESMRRVRARKGIS